MRTDNPRMKALKIYAGPVARLHIQRHGLRPQDVRVIAGAAGGPKGLILGALDRYLFGDWLTQSAQPVDLVGASIGAWRMATACLSDPVRALQRMENDYVQQHYELGPGQRRPTADFVSERFARGLQDFFAGRVGEVLRHPRYRLHILTSRGRGLLRREHAVATPLGYLGAYLVNAVSRRAMGGLLERVVFSVVEPGIGSRCAALPFTAHDYRTRQLPLTEANFAAVLQASCSIPFVLRSVSAISGAPAGAYWDGGITDYHLHLCYAGGTADQAARSAASEDGAQDSEPARIVLYPHFQRSVVPGWLDKGLPWRHRASAFLDTTVLLAPNPDWVATLPRGKLPDRQDFAHFGNDLAARVRAWRGAIAASEQLVDEFQGWLQRCHADGASEVEPL